MTKDEALDLALDALDNLLYWDNGKSDYDQAREAITAIKQARALDKMAENARELGLDYEPVAWKDLAYGNLHHQDFGNSIPLYTTPPAAQRQWVGLTDEEVMHCYMFWVVDLQDIIGFYKGVETKLKERNT